MSPYELIVGLRYTRAGKGARRNRFISFIALTSMAGIALGVAALIVVLSVMNGFQRELRARILAVASHIEVRGVPNLADWQAVADLARSEPHVVASAPFVTGQGMLSAGAVHRGVVVRGIDPAREDAVADLGKSLQHGPLTELRAGAFGIVLGAELARALAVARGDTVVLIAPQPERRDEALPQAHAFGVTDIFEIGMYEYDSGLALVHLADAQRLFGVAGVSGLRLKLDDPLAAPTVANRIARALPLVADVRDWTQSHVNFFRAVGGQKRMMFVILAMIIAVAAFNVVATQVMVVTDKQADIAILRTLGATPASILAIFVIQGALIGATGTLLGVAAGIALAANIDVVVPALERVLGIRFLDKSVYHISELPAELQRADVIAIAGVALALALLATLYPAWKAARVNPAAALRYE